MLSCRGSTTPLFTASVHASLTSDDEFFYTVSTYNETVPEGTRLTPGLLREQLERELGEAFDWDALLAAVRDLADGLVKSAAVAIGDWPSSRAYYGIDVIVEREEGGALMPKLLEVNFQGDWGAPQHAAESNDCTQELGARHVHRVRQVGPLGAWVLRLLLEHLVAAGRGRGEGGGGQQRGAG
jgi:hypothetical protein